MRFLTLGFDPTTSSEDVPIMPKNRYDIMRAYMPTRGTLGLDMMLRSCTIQVRQCPCPCALSATGIIGRGCPFELRANYGDKNLSNVCHCCRNSGRHNEQPCLQVNLDFCSEADMVDTMRLGIALQPLATALFANSPFRDGKPTGYLSWRSHVWTDTDPDRCACRPNGSCLFHTTSVEH